MFRVKGFLDFVWVWIAIQAAYDEAMRFLLGRGVGMALEIVGCYFSQENFIFTIFMCLYSSSASYMFNVKLRSDHVSDEFYEMFMICDALMHYHWRSHFWFLYLHCVGSCLHFVVFFVA